MCTQTQQTELPLTGRNLEPTTESGSVRGFYLLKTVFWTCLPEPAEVCCVYRCVFDVAHLCFQSAACPVDVHQHSVCRSELEEFNHTVHRPLSSKDQTHVRLKINHSNTDVMKCRCVTCTSSRQCWSAGVSPVFSDFSSSTRPSTDVSRPVWSEHDEIIKPHWHTLKGLLMSSHHVTHLHRFSSARPGEAGWSSVCCQAPIPDL